MLSAMLVDDEILSLRMLESIIDWHRFGIELVAMAQDGNSAWQLFLKHRPNLILTDIRMPGMDGLTFLRRVKELGGVAISQSLGEALAAAADAVSPAGDPHPRLLALELRRTAAAISASGQTETALADLQKRSPSPTLAMTAFNLRVYAEACGGHFTALVIATGGPSIPSSPRRGRVRRRHRRRHLSALAASRHDEQPSITSSWSSHSPRSSSASTRPAMVVCRGQMGENGIVGKNESCCPETPDAWSAVGISPFGVLILFMVSSSKWMVGSDVVNRIAVALFGL